MSELLEIQSPVIRQMAKRVSPALAKGNSPTDSSQYLNIKIEGDEISLIVARQGRFFAKTTVSVSALGEGFVKVLGRGTFAVNGELLTGNLATSETPGPLTLSFEKSKAKAQTPDAADELADKPLAAVEIGRISLSYPGFANKKSKFQCVDVVNDPTIEFDPATKLVLKGSDFIRYVKQVEMAVGKASMSVDYSNMLIVANSSGVQFVTTNGLQLARARFDHLECSKDVKIVVPYDLAAAIAKMCQEDKNICIYSRQGTPQQIVFCQDEFVGDKVVGKTVFNVSEAPDRFPEYEQIINNMNYCSTCVIKRQQLKTMCHEINFIPTVQTAAVYDVEASLIIVKKVSPEADVQRDMPMLTPTGQRLELNVSSRHLTDAAEQGESEDIELKFSGKSSLAMMTLSPHLTLHFQPFGKE